LVPFTGEIVVALEDQSSLPTLQSMLHGETIAATIAMSWKVLRLKSAAFLP
jgi:hypothetical protein